MLLPASCLLAGVAAALSLAELPSWRALAAGALVVSVLALRGPLRLLAWAGVGFLLTAAQGQRLLAADWPCTRDRERVPVSGTIGSPAEVRAGRVDFDLLADTATRGLGVSPRLRLSWYEPSATPQPGEAWGFEARLRCRSGFANPGGYDRELALLRDGYGATGYASGDAGHRAGIARAAFVERARAWMANRIELAAAHTQSVGVMQGLAVGLRGSIPEPLRDAFVATGTAHLIAISGMHVTAFAMVVVLASRTARRWVGAPAISRRWPAFQAGLVVLVTTGYGLLAGASLPTLRTVVMVALVAALRVARRSAGVASVLGAAAVLMVGADPLAVTSAGFWLSFAAVAALVSLASAPAGAGSLLQAFVRSQAAVTAMLAPLLLASFGAVSLVGPLANAIAIPLFSFAILPVTLAAMALAPVLPALADRLWALLGAGLDRCWTGLLAMAAWPGATFSPPEPPAWLVAAGLAAIALGLVIPGPACKCLAACVLGAMLLRPAPAPGPGEFELAVLDVGHGLASVVRTRSRTLVFDTGPAWRGGGDAARVTLVPFLRAYGVRRVDLLVVSHEDNDHAGGLSSLRGAVEVSRTLGVAPGSAGGRGERACVAGQGWEWDGVGFEILHPPPEHALDDNEGSCALRVRAPSGTALLLADQGRRAERMLLEQDLRADVVLVPHHGSAGSSTPQLVAAVGAREALVSNGFGNRWGLPRNEVVARWQAGGARVLTTAHGGALLVRFRADGTAPEVSPYRDADPRWWRRRE